MAIEPPKSQRDQGLAAGAAIAIILIGVFYWYVTKPKNEELALVQTRIDTLTSQNDVARREVARGTASKVKEEADQCGRMLVLMRTLVPTANEVPVLLDQVSTAARKAGLDIGGSSPLGVISGDIFDTHKFQIKVTGPYHKIAQFITNIGSM